MAQAGLGTLMLSCTPHYIAVPVNPCASLLHMETWPCPSEGSPASYMLFELLGFIWGRAVPGF
jgi:hypothetical protein